VKPRSVRVIQILLPNGPWYRPVTEFTPLAFAGNDDGDVLVFIRYAFTVTATGKHVAMNMHHYWKFRDGKACFVRSSEDTAQVTAALAP
jgi:ketosteroid isomerase-like protein